MSGKILNVAFQLKSLPSSHGIHLRVLAKGQRELTNIIRRPKAGCKQNPVCPNISLYRFTVVERAIFLYKSSVDIWGSFSIHFTPGVKSRVAGGQADPLAT